MSTPPIVWTIAGFDPSSGAGITADLKTISSFDCYGVACITALTVQNTLGVRRVEPICPQTVLQTLQALLEDLPPRTIKIGMLATSEIAGIVADFLLTLPRSTCSVVLDPILRSSSGAELLDPAGIRLLRSRLLPLATVVTPNRSEAALLTGLPGSDVEAMARCLRRLGAAAAVVTGGDATGGDATPGDATGGDATPGDATSGDAIGGGAASEPAISDRDRQHSNDVLAYSVGGMELVETLSAPRIQSTSTHGTGCAFSTAIACALACGQNVPNAVTSAKAFVCRAIQHAAGLGHGNGPMGLERAGKA